MHSEPVLLLTVDVAHCYGISTNLVVIVLVALIVSRPSAWRFHAICLGGQGWSGKARFSEHTVLIPLGMMRRISNPSRRVQSKQSHRRHQAG